MKQTLQMQQKARRLELEEISRSRDRRVWESDDEYVARTAKNKARELVLNEEMKAGVVDGKR